MAEPPHSYVPPNGFVPDAQTAIEIAKAVWRPIYGTRHLDQEPFKAELKNDVWHVEGSLPEGYLGGVAEAEIAKSTGCILRVSHGQQAHNNAVDGIARFARNPSLKRYTPAGSEMRTILCFGDSNTWGDPPGGGGRFPWGKRWPGVTQSALGTEFRIIEEGLPGRTTCFDDPFSPQRNGLTYLPLAFETHYPLDLLIMMLGTNDLKANFNLSAFDIARGASRLLVTAKSFRPAIAQILLVSPPHVTNTDDVDISQQFPDGVEKSKALAAHYKRCAELNGCHFFDAASVAKTSTVDGIHMDAQNHGLLGEGLARKIASIFEGRV